MEYDCVIATRNRISALQMSIPLILQQDIVPDHLIIVDASDNHAAVNEAVHNICNTYNYRGLRIIKSDAANSSRQRNIGLDLVTAPVVMFPDDDSLWHPGFAKNILSVYERDIDRTIGGITGVASPDLPSDASRPTYAKNRLALLKAAIQPFRNILEEHVTPKPFDLFARTMWSKKIPLVDDVNVKRVETVGGFRMTFRTEVVKKTRFDEVLGYGVGYAQHEDMDASLGVQASGYALVSAENAKVHHYVFPGKRAKGYNYGFCQIANYIYVCRKRMPQVSSIYIDLERFLIYKLFLYGLRYNSSFGREVLHGAFDAWKNRSRLLTAETEQLSGAYMSLCDEYIRR